MMVLLLMSMPNRNSVRPRCSAERLGVVRSRVVVLIEVGDKIIVLVETGKKPHVLTGEPHGQTQRRADLGSSLPIRETVLVIVIVDEFERWRFSSEYRSRLASLP